MPSSDPARQSPDGRLARLLRQRAIGTTALTLLLAGLLGLLNWRGEIVVRDGAGIARVVPLVTIWETFFTRLPQRAPGILQHDPLFIGLILAFLALAYILVATLRLPE